MSDVIWKKRHEHSASLFQDEIWAAGFPTEPLYSKVRPVEIPETWFGDR